MERKLFQSCYLQLTQKPNANDPTTWRWVNAKLLAAKNPPYPGDAGAGEWAAYLNQYPYYGKWTLGANSQTQTADTTYTIGTSANQQYKFWRYSISNWALEFYEAMPEVGGGLAYGETVTKPDVAVILNKAKMTKRGIVPFNESGAGPGSVEVPSGILRRGSPVYWEKATGN
jgi:hypothetical protein